MAASTETINQSSDIHDVLAVIERMDKLRNWIWSCVIGVFVLGLAYANVTNGLTNLGHENELRKNEITAIIDDRKATLLEARQWRDKQSAQMGEALQGIRDLQDEIGRSK